MKSEVFNMDCMDYMRTLPNKAFTLAIADPPYGLIESGAWKRTSAGSLRGRIMNESKKKFNRWDKAPSQEFFDELQRVSEHRIIWGGNYFPLPPARCVLCWDKVQPWENFAQVELAWTDIDWPAQLFRYDNRQGGKIHPTQKPVELYTWILKKFAHDGDTIFDPMMGSQSSRIAAYKMGFDYVGCELDKEYFDKGCERFNRECKGEIVTKDGSVIKQMSLFDL
jgi:site-specific DNA-methyltransferase (adenine-specific)